MYLLFHSAALFYYFIQQINHIASIIELILHTEKMSFDMLLDLLEINEGRYKFSS